MVSEVSSKYLLWQAFVYALVLGASLHWTPMIAVWYTGINLMLAVVIVLGRVLAE